MFQDVDIEKLASDVKLLKDCVKAQERKIKQLEEKVAEFEKADQSDESDDDAPAEIGEGDDAGSDHAWNCSHAAYARSAHNICAADIRRSLDGNWDRFRSSCLCIYFGIYISIYICL